MVSGLVSSRCGVPHLSAVRSTELTRALSDTKPFGGSTMAYHVPRTKNQIILCISSNFLMSDFAKLLRSDGFLTEPNIFFCPRFKFKPLTVHSIITKEAALKQPDCTFYKNTVCLYFRWLANSLFCCSGKNN